MDKEYDRATDIQEFFTKTFLTTKPMNNEDKSTVFDVLQKTCFYSMTHNEGLNSTRTKDATYDLPKAIAKTHNPPLPPPTNENEEEVDNLQGEGIEKTIFASNIVDIYTRLQVLLGLKPSGLTDTLTEGTNLLDELYKKM